MQEMISAFLTLFFPVFGQLIGRYILKHWTDLELLLFSIPPFSIIPSYLFYNNLSLKDLDINYKSLFLHLIYILLIIVIILLIGSLCITGPLISTIIKSPTELKLSTDNKLIKYI
tara:strand:- start:187 stop:531 length:345 start_codon:yes stop_codon:yes gene_type:complete